MEIAGTECLPMIDFVQRYLHEKGDNKVVILNAENKYMSFEVPKDLLDPLGEFYAGSITFEEWIKANL